MELLRAAIAIFEVICWAAVISVAVVLVAALVRGTIEDIRDHRRIVVARIARGISPPPSTWQGTIWMPVTRMVRRSLHL
jgi:hypothetical protein